LLEAELALNRFVTVLGDNDADFSMAGVRLFPMPEKWGIRYPCRAVDVLVQDGHHVSGGSAYAPILWWRPNFKPSVRHGSDSFRQSRDFENVPLQEVCERFCRRNSSSWTGNVSVTIVRLELGYTVVVEYEIVGYNRNELDVWA